MANFLVFHIQKYGYLVDKTMDTNNCGVAVWIAFVIGSGLQTIGYLIIIANTDWDEVSMASRSRQEPNLKQVDESLLNGVENIINEKGLDLDHTRLYLQNQNTTDDSPLSGQQSPFELN